MHSSVHEIFRGRNLSVGAMEELIKFSKVKLPMAKEQTTVVMKQDVCRAVKGPEKCFVIELAFQNQASVTTNTFALVRNIQCHTEA